jgi:ABC-type sugar transport system permease subunit
LRPSACTHPPGSPIRLWAKPALVIMSLWGVGNAMVIYLAGLQDVPRELYEAAEIDGATGDGVGASGM